MSIPEPEQCLCGALQVGVRQHVVTATFQSPKEEIWKPWPLSFCCQTLDLNNQFYYCTKKMVNAEFVNNEYSLFLNQSFAF